MNNDLQQFHTTPETPDGWNLNLIFYPGQTRKKAKTPVILCHGLAANKHSCDFGEVGTNEWNTYSLAAYLSQGMYKDKTSFDTWVIQLRGRGHLTFNPKQHPEKYIWCFDDYINSDVPTILSYIQNQYSKKQKILWVGKSMGGMIAYAYGQQTSSHQYLKGVVTIGSPALFEYKNPFLEFISRIAPRNISLPVNISQILQKIQEIKDTFKAIGATSENIDEDIFDYYLLHGMDNMISSKMFSHFSVFFRHNTFCSYPRYPWLFDLIGYGPMKNAFNIYNYKDNLIKFIHPILAIAGQADKEAPPEEVLQTMNHVGSIDKTTHVFSKTNGYVEDYGHLDLNLGKKVKEEVYPLITKWLIHHTK
jgi:pimeloyl-ACP methyl ester carboxylesterase